MTREAEHERRIDLTVLSLPVITVVSLILFVGWSTFTVAEEKGRIDKRLDNTTELIEQLALATKDLAESAALRTKIWWSREDMVGFCRDLKDLNANFRCPNIATYGYSPTLDSTLPLEGIKKKLDRVKEKAHDAVSQSEGLDAKRK